MDLKVPQVQTALKAQLAQVQMEHKAHRVLVGLKALMEHKALMD
jgi:hypothetical protein